MDRAIEAYAEYGTIGKAAEMSGVSYETIRKARIENPQFDESMEVAWKRYGDLVADEVRRRAVEGWEEPVFQRGELIGHVRKYSDRMLELMAKRTNTEFKERVAVEQKGTVQHEHTHTVDHNLENLSVDEQEQLLALLEKTESPIVDSTEASPDSSRVTH